MDVWYSDTAQLIGVSNLNVIFFIFRLHLNDVALKIHISSSTESIIKRFNKFTVECRGEIEMKVGLNNVCPILFKSDSSK